MSLATIPSPSPSPPPRSQSPLNLLELFFMLSGGDRHTKLAPSDLASHIIDVARTGKDPTPELVQVTMSFWIFATDFLDALMPELKATLELDEVRGLLVPVPELEQDTPAKVDGAPQEDRSEVDMMSFPEAFAIRLYRSLEKGFSYEFPECEIGPESGNVPPAMLSALSVKLGFPSMGETHSHLKTSKMGLNLDGLQLDENETFTMPIHLKREVFAIASLIMFAVVGVERYAHMILVDHGANYQDIIAGVRALEGEVQNEACRTLLEVVLKDFADGSNEGFCIG